MGRKVSHRDAMLPFVLMSYGEPSVCVCGATQKKTPTQYGKEKEANRETP